MDPVRLILALALIVGLLWFALRLVRTRRPQEGALTLLQYFPLGPRRGVAAIRAYDEVLVLGVTAQSIQLLRRLPAEQVPESPPSKGRLDFRSVLGGLGEG